VCCAVARESNPRYLIWGDRADVSRNDDLARVGFACRDLESLLMSCEGTGTAFVSRFGIDDGRSTPGDLSLELCRLPLRPDQVHHL